MSQSGHLYGRGRSGRFSSEFCMLTPIVGMVMAAAAIGVPGWLPGWLLDWLLSCDEVCDTGVEVCVCWSAGLWRELDCTRGLRSGLRRLESM